MQPNRRAEGAVRLIQQLLHPGTGLAAPSEGEPQTDVHHNALAVFALTHEGLRHAAERILHRFERFLSSRGDAFDGFPQRWYTSTGMPETGAVSWERDAALLLLALDYFDGANFQTLRAGLVDFLCARARQVELIQAEGVAVMYAALLPHARAPTLAHLRAGFYARDQLCSGDLSGNVLHIALAALVFDDFSGFQHLPRLRRLETWAYDEETQVSLYGSTCASPVAANVQLLLAATRYRNDLTFEPPNWMMPSRNSGCRVKPRLGPTACLGA